MKKDFDRWNEIKKEIHAVGQNKLYGEREVWWCRLGINVGFEQDGTSQEYERPVLVLRGFSRQVCLVVPLTTSQKKNPYHVPIGNVDGKEAFAIISQIRLVDTKRFVNKASVLDKKTFEIVRKTAKDVLDGLSFSPSQGQGRSHL